MLTLETMTPRQRKTLARIARPEQRNVLGCERCNYICVDAVPCHCCASRTGYPDDNRGHYAICTLADLKASLTA